MRILLINRYFGGQQTPTGRMLKDVALTFQSMGHQVELLTSASLYVGTKTSAQKEVKGISLRYVRELRLGRILRWVSFWIGTLGSLSSRRWDCCVLLTDPPFLPLASSLTKIFRSSRQRVFWWTMDLYPEALVAAGMLHQSSFIHRCLKWFNNVGLRHLEGVIALGVRQEQLLQTYPQWSKSGIRAVIVPPWDLRPILRTRDSSNQVLRQLSSNGTKIALYTGNLGEGHIFAPFVDSAGLFLSQGRTDWAFVFVVRGTGRPKIEKLASDLPNLFIMDYLPESETSELLWSATVHLVSMKPNWEGIIVPSKLYGALQTEAPILFLGPLDADSSSEIKRLERGLSLSPEATGTEVANALDNLADSKWKRTPYRDDTAPLRIANFVTQ